MSSAAGSLEMPRYRSYKTVHALQIGNLEAEESRIDSALWMSPVEAGYARIFLDNDYVVTHQPRLGGYYVVYADGYKSFSPAKAFEEGYTKESV